MTTRHAYQLVYSPFRRLIHGVRERQRRPPKCHYAALTDEHSQRLHEATQAREPRARGRLPSTVHCLNPGPSVTGVRPLLQQPPHYWYCTYSTSASSRPAYSDFLFRDPGTGVLGKWIKRGGAPDLRRPSIGTF